MTMALKSTKAEAQAWLAEHDDMRITGAGWQEEVYTHQIEGTFATARLRALIEALKRVHPEVHKSRIVRFPITKGMIETHQADVSDSRIAQIPLDVAENEPGMWIEMKDGTHIIIDGNHRLQKLIRAGKTEALGFIIPNAIAEQYRVKIEFHKRGCAADEGWEELSPDMDLAMMMGEFPHHAAYSPRSGEQR